MKYHSTQIPEISITHYYIDGFCFCVIKVYTSIPVTFAPSIILPFELNLQHIESRDHLCSYLLARQKTYFLRSQLVCLEI